MTTQNDDMVELAKMLAQFGRERETMRAELTALRDANARQSDTLQNIAAVIRAPNGSALAQIPHLVQAIVDQRNKAEAELEELEAKQLEAERDRVASEIPAVAT